MWLHIPKLDLRSAWMPGLSPTLCFRAISRRLRKGRYWRCEGPLGGCPGKAVWRSSLTAALLGRRPYGCPLGPGTLKSGSQGRPGCAGLPPKFLLPEPSKHPVSETLSPGFFSLGSEYRRSMGAAFHWVVKPCNAVFSVFSLSLPDSLPPSFPLVSAALCL